MSNTGRGMGRNGKGVTTRRKKQTGDAGQHLALVDDAISRATKALCAWDDEAGDDADKAAAPDDKTVRTLIALRAHYSKLKDETGETTALSDEANARYGDLVNR